MRSQAVSARNEWPEPQSERTPECWPVLIVLSKPALAGVGALRGVPARMGRTRRRLDRGERRFPGNRNLITSAHSHDYH